MTRAQNLQCLLLVFVLNGATTLANGELKLTRACPIYTEASFFSQVACRLPKGTEVKWDGFSVGIFLMVEVDGCSGYANRNCLKGPSVSPTRETSQSERPIIPKARSSRRKILSENDSFETSGTFSFLRLGIGAGVDSQWASVSGATSSNKGLGLSVALQAVVHLSEGFEVLLSPGYQRSSLSRTVDGTGRILDGNPAKYSQTVQFAGLTTLACLALFKSRFNDTSSGDPDWWMDGGFEVLLPISATQTDNFGDTNALTNTGKLFLLLFGPRGDFFLGSKANLGVGIQGFYNLGASGGDKYFGARLLVSLQFGL